MRQTTNKIKLYVREVELQSDADQDTLAEEGENIDRVSSARSALVSGCKGSLAWSPLYNHTLLLRRTFNERVIHIFEDDLKDLLRGGTVILRGPLRLCWSILHPCDLNCPYCLDGGKGLVTPPFNIQEAHLGRMLSSKYLLTMDFSGGEPLLHKRLYDLLDQAQKAGVGTTITTHGGLLEQHAERLSAYVDGVRVSIDGSTAEKHDHLRGKPGLFLTLMKGVKKLVANKVRFRVNTVVMKPNVKDLEQIIVLARDLGAEEISLLQFLPIGEGMVNSSDYFIKTQRFLEIGNELKARYESPGFEIRLRDLEGATGYVTVYANGLTLANADLDSGNTDHRQETLGMLSEHDLDSLWQKRFSQQIYHFDPALEF